MQRDNQGPLFTGRARLQRMKEERAGGGMLPDTLIEKEQQKLQGQAPLPRDQCPPFQKSQRNKNIIQTGRAWLDQQGEGSDRDNSSMHGFFATSVRATPHRPGFVPMFGFSTPIRSSTEQKFPRMFSLDTPDCTPLERAGQPASVRLYQERMGAVHDCPASETNVSRQSKMGRPRTQKKPIEQTKALEDIHFWQLRRAMRCLRYFEMQWGFVNAQLQSSMDMYREKAENELAKLTLSTCHLQNKLGDLKDQKSQFDNIERAEKFASGLGPVLDKLHHQKGPFMQKWKLFRRALVSRLESLPIGEGICLGGSDTEESLDSLARVMIDILRTLERLDDMFFERSHILEQYDSAQAHSIKTDIPSQEPHCSDASYEKKLLREPAQQTISAGKISQEISDLVSRHTQFARELHALVCTTTKKRIILSSLRLQVAQLREQEASEDLRSMLPKD